VHPLTSAPDRLALAGDWHGDTDHAESVIGWAARHGANGVVQLGDFGIWHGSDGQEYLDAVQAALTETGIWLVFVDGNHEDFDLLLSLPLDEHEARPVRPSIWHLPRGLTWQWHGKVWLAMGGATSLDRPHRRPHVSWWPQESITALDMGKALESFEQGRPVEHMLTHDCPAGVTIPDLPPDSMWPPAELDRANAHRRVLAEVVDWAQPKHLWHGHFHVRHDAERVAWNHVAQIHGLNDNTGPWHQNVHLLDLTAPGKE
jgi:hypothetical protein